MEAINIQEVKKLCDRGALRAFIMNGGVYLEDTATREKVRLDNPNVAGNSRVEWIFGSRESWDCQKQGSSRKKKRKQANPKPDNGVDEGQGPYTGFLMVECEECGEVKCFCAKKDTYGFKCQCGHVTALENLRYAYMECKCGKRSVYRTNINRPTASGTCVACSAPVDLELNRGGTKYVTIR